MKRFLVYTIAALAILASIENKASAWSKCHFNIGMNFTREAADNSFLWGLYRNGPHPFAHGGGHNPGYVPDHNPYPYYNPYGQGGAPTAPTLPTPVQSSPATMPQAAAQSGANYPYPGATQPIGHWNYPQQNYYYPTTNWNPPSYWYGNN